MGAATAAVVAAQRPDLVSALVLEDPARYGTRSHSELLRRGQARANHVNRTLADLPWPVLMVHGVLSNELPDTAEATAEGFPLLPDSSQMVHVHAETLDQAQEEVARLSLEWAQRRLR